MFFENGGGFFEDGEGVFDFPAPKNEEPSPSSIFRLRRTKNPSFSFRNREIEEPSIFVLWNRKSKNPPFSVFGTENRRTLPYSVFGMKIGSKIAIGPVVSPRKRPTLLLSRASKTTVLNVSSETRTTETVWKPMEGHNERLTTGLSAVYPWDQGRSSFLAADQCTDAYLSLQILPDMLCMKRVNCSLCSPIGLNRISVVRASGESFRTVVLDALEARGSVVSWANRPVGDPSCSAPPCPAALLCAALPRPARGMSGFWIRQMNVCLGFGFDK